MKITFNIDEDGRFVSNVLDQGTSIQASGNITVMEDEKRIRESYAQFLKSLEGYCHQFSYTRTTAGK